MDIWKKVGEGTSNNQWRFMNFHYKDTRPENMRPGQKLSLKNCLYLSNEAGCSQTVSVLQNLPWLLHIINLKKDICYYYILVVEHPIYIHSHTD